MNELVAAISVGIVAGEVRLDLEYVEDVNADVDLNIVALETGRMVEIQGTAEHAPFDRAQLDEMIDTGTRGIRTLLELQRQAIAGTAG
jgi:ribonuclease PH